MTSELGRLKAALRRHRFLMSARAIKVRMIAKGTPSHQIPASQSSRAFTRNGRLCAILPPEAIDNLDAPFGALGDLDPHGVEPSRAMTLVA